MSELIEARQEQSASDCSVRGTQWSKLCLSYRDGDRERPSPQLDTA